MDGCEGQKPPGQGHEARGTDRSCFLPSFPKCKATSSNRRRLGCAGAADARAITHCKLRPKQHPLHPRMDPLGGWGWAGLDWTSRGNWATQALGLQHLTSLGLKRAGGDGESGHRRWISVVESVFGFLVPFDGPQGAPARQARPRPRRRRDLRYASKCAAATGSPENKCPAQLQPDFLAGTEEGNPPISAGVRAPAWSTRDAAGVLRLVAG